MPVFQKAKMDFEFGFGGEGVVRDGGSSVNDIGGSGSYGKGDVPGIEGYCILKIRKSWEGLGEWFERRSTMNAVRILS